MVIPDIRALCSTIEGKHLRFELAIANDLNQFKRFATATSTVMTLGKMVCDFANKEKSQSRVALRVAELLAERQSLDYENPNDTAIAIYLYVLQECESPYTLGLALAVRAHPNMWWSRQIAREVLIGKVFSAV